MADHISTIAANLLSDIQIIFHVADSLMSMETTIGVRLRSKPAWYCRQKSKQTSTETCGPPVLLCAEEAWFSQVLVLTDSCTSGLVWERVEAASCTRCKCASCTFLLDSSVLEHKLMVELIIASSIHSRSVTPCGVFMCIFPAGLTPASVVLPQISCWLGRERQRKACSLSFWSCVPAGSWDTG